MAKRMFSTEIVDSDAFLDMGQGAQLLYFHLGMRCDDDGFLGNPMRIMRNIGVNSDDLKVLITKKFIIPFESGVVVVKHHRMNNNWDKYNCKRTVYREELGKLFIKENKAYTLDETKGLPVQTVARLDSVGTQSLEEKRIDKKKVNTLVLKDDLPEWLDREAWSSWIQYRSETRHKLTAQTVKLQLRFLEKDIKNHKAIIEQSIQNGWTGLFAYKGSAKRQDAPKEEGKYSKIKTTEA